MALWIAGAERITSGRGGATYREPSSPWRFVFHTMEAPEDDPRTSADEGWDLAQLKRYISSFPYPPQLWAYPEADWVGQCIPLNLSGYALRHESGDPETNHKHAIQVEILDFASDTPCIDHAEWLGERVIRPVMDAGIPLNLSHLAPSTGSDGYGEDGAVRQSWAWWAAFDGICGHANVPGNSHWDPGRADYAAIARAAAGTTVPPEEEDDMYIIRAANRGVLLLGAGGIRSIYGRHREALMAAGIKQKVVTAGEFDDLLTLPAAPATVSLKAEQIADAVIAKLPAGSVDAGLVKAAVKDALREGTE